MIGLILSLGLGLRLIAQSKNEVKEGVQSRRPTRREKENRDRPP